MIYEAPGRSFHISDTVVNDLFISYEGLEGHSIS